MGEEVVAEAVLERGSLASADRRQLALEPELICSHIRSTPKRRLLR